MGLMDQAQAPQEQPALDQPAPEGTADQGGAQDEQVQDPLLEQMIQGIEAKLPPNVQSMYHAAAAGRSFPWLSFVINPINLTVPSTAGPATSCPCRLDILSLNIEWV